MRIDFSEQGLEGYARAWFDPLTPWPIEECAVDAARVSHVLEHLSPHERAFFLNELWRVLDVDAECAVEITHWLNPAAAELAAPLIREQDWLLWSREIRDGAGYEGPLICHFDIGFGYNLASRLDFRCEEFRTEAWKADLLRPEFTGTAILDFVGTIKKCPLTP